MEKNEPRNRTVVPTTTVQFPGSLAANKQSIQLSVRLDKKSQRATLIGYLLEGWLDPLIYKAAIIEAVGTAGLCYLSGMFGVTVGTFETAQIAPFVAIFNAILAPIFIFASAPVSGGHINPMITFATVITGLTRPARGFVYLVGQLCGAAIAGGLIRAAIGEELAKSAHGGGCFRDSSSTTVGQAFAIEATSAYIILFLAFGLALDPRQAELTGPRVGPILVGVSLGLILFVSAQIHPGYGGASANPARCFAFAVASSDFKDQWIYWVGPLTGSLLEAVLYYFIPPYCKVQEHIS